jgi:hypothetical protein
MRFAHLKVAVGHCARACVLVGGIGLGWASRAQQAVQQPYQEYDKKLRSAELVGALSSDQSIRRGSR